jgi:hypothetical protein
MALVLKDRVQETTTTTGTGVVTLDGAATGFQAFSAVGSGNETYYTITDGTDWEVGIGPYVDVPSPDLSLDFSAVTTLPAGITFTRATNGTFFNSTGVLSTAASGAARFDHRKEGGVWVNKGLLIEEQRVNYAGNSESLTKTFTGSNNLSLDIIDATTSNNSVFCPNGNQEGGSFNKTTTAGRATTYLNNPGATKNVRYTFSVFLRTGTLTTARLDMVCQTQSTSFSYRINATFTLSGNGSVGSIGYSAAADGTNPPQNATVAIEFFDVAGGWYRCSISGTSYNGANALNATLFEIRPTPASASGSIRIWGRQIELGFFPTSYIKTTSLATVTRNADVASMTSTNFSSWYNASEGSIFWQGDTANAIALTNVALRGYEISDGTTNERIGFNLGFEGNTRSFFGSDGGASQWNIFSPDPAVALVANQTYKAASAYKLNDFAHSLDGNSPETDTSGTLPTVNKINLGADLNGANLVNGHIAKFYYWNTRLSNGTLQFLSGTGTLSSGNYLQRTNPVSSSNSNALVDWSAGTKTVFSPLPAQATLGSAATADNSSIGTDQYAWTNFKKLLDQSVIGGVAYGNNGTNGIISTYSLVQTLSSGAYWGGVLSPNGDIHFVPYGAVRGQKVSASGVVSTYSLVSTSTNVAYAGGVLASNGDIHFVPSGVGGARGQKVSASGVVSTYSLVYTAITTYIGGVLAPNGDIHFVPNAAAVGQKVSASGVVSTYSLAYTLSSFSYYGGVLDPNGDIHFVPRAAPVGQKVSAAGVVSTYSLVYTTSSGAYVGGVLAPNGDIHFIPRAAPVGQKVSPSGVVSTYSLVYTTSSGAYFGGVLAPNGDIHFLPASATVGQKISASGVVSTYSLLKTGSFLYIGGVLRPDGSIVLAPYSDSVGQIISTNPGIPLGQEACLSSYLNKF